jgi:hypothetical protein
MDAETKEDPTDYIATIPPEFLNLTRCEPSHHSNVIFYFLIFILFFLLFQIVLKLKVIHYNIISIMTILLTLKNKQEKIDVKNNTSVKDNTGVKDSTVVPDLIFDFIQQLDKHMLKKLD